MSLGPLNGKIKGIPKWEMFGMVEEFKSRLEDYIPAVELNFPSTPAFGKYKPFLDHAVAHPAKANTKLLEYLILNYTKPGDVILDPMAGSGSTGVVAALHGRNAIQIDIERK
ncbi:MAG: site-specific DNA-methyltransferase, partial [archaeon YNP-LCB-003-016]|uniref:DNA methyltransferase n=1 Tax=Candidatus Culexarchaeum yellowstonense TaxID=2928963 RepID=UPI0026F17F08